MSARPISVKRHAVLLLGALAWLAYPVLAGADPRTWLERMAYALEYLNYEGTLIQLQGSEAAVMRIVHRVKDGVPTERITAMDEVGREIIRQGEDVTCILPDQNAVVVEYRENQKRDASPLRLQFSRNMYFDDRYYRLAIASGGKLVGRDTRVVTVRPPDGFRYGYLLWLDHATAIPLKVQVSDEGGTVVEQLLFSDISLPEEIPDSAVQPSGVTDSYTWHRSSKEEATGEVTESPAGWRVESLPPGFTLKAVRAQRSGASGEPLDHLVYSDGVATVSVFLESGVAPDEQSEGPSRAGAANAYTRVADGRLITAVGEVPVRTVETIARSIRPVRSAPPATR